MTELGIPLVSLIKINLAKYIDDELEEQGYIIGTGYGEISVVDDWFDFDFSLPSISLEVSAEIESIESIGDIKINNYRSTIRVFGRNQLEIDQICEFLKDKFYESGIILLDYNDATPVSLGYIYCKTAAWVNNRVEKPDGSLDKIGVISMKIEVREEI